MASRARLAETIQRVEGGTLKTRILGMLMFVVAWNAVVGPSARADGYLSRTGPVPLRFAVEKPAATPKELPPLAMEDPVPVREADLKAAAAETNAVALFPSEPGAGQSESSTASFDASPAPIPQPLPEPIAPPELATGPTPPASDMLVVTPQMLVEYFKPGLANTNSASMAVYVPVGFTPPSPVMATAPSSRATYRTQ